MSENTLSAEEIDALLTAVREGNIATPDPGYHGPVDECEISVGEPLTIGEVPSLDRVDRLFARHMQTDLQTLLNDSVTVAYDSSDTQTFEQYRSNLEPSTLINLIVVEEQDARMIIVLTAKLVREVVSFYFGGQTIVVPSEEESDLSTIEEQFAKRLLHIAFDNLAKAWSGVLPIRLRLSKTESDPSMCNFFVNNEKLHISKTTITLSDDLALALEIAIPNSVLKPIKELLLANERGSRSDQRSAWKRAIENRLAETQIDTRVELVRIPISVHELVKLKVGDFIPFDLPEELPLLVGDTPVCKGKYGASSGKNGLLIEHQSDEKNIEHGETL